MRYRLSEAADAHLENILIQGALAFGKSTEEKSRIYTKIDLRDDTMPFDGQTGLV